MIIFNFKKSKFFLFLVTASLSSQGAYSGGQFSTLLHNNDPLFTASQSGRTEVVRKLLAEITPKQNDVHFGLIAAATAGHLEVVKLLVKRCSDVDAIKTSIGLNRGHEEILHLLTQRKEFLEKIGNYVQEVKQETDSNEKDLVALRGITELFGAEGIHTTFENPLDWDRSVPDHHELGGRDAIRGLHQPFLSFCERVMKNEDYFTLEELNKELSCYSTPCFGD